jgi:hypothetical protein
MASINPEPEYGPYPVTNIPDPGDAGDALVLLAILTDIHNRIVFLREASDLYGTKFTNTETQTGLDLSTADLPIFSSGNSQVFIFKYQFIFLFLNDS